MKRYTLIINYRYRDSAYQIEADNLREAQHRLIDEYQIEGIGGKARQQLHLDIDDPRWEAKPIMEEINVWRASYWIHNDYLTVHIVKTVQERDHQEPSVSDSYTDGFYTDEQFKPISRKIDQLEEQKDWAGLKRYCLRVCNRFPEEYYPMIKAAMACRFLHQPEEMLEYAQRAYDNWHEDPLNRFWLALALYENRRYEEAIRLSDMILRDDFRWLAHGQYGYNADYAWQLINDCKAIKGLSLLAEGQSEGRRYLREYLQRVKEKTSCFRKADIRKAL